jgi:hypothetical protein
METKEVSTAGVARALQILELWVQQYVNSLVQERVPGGESAPTETTADCADK